MAISNVSNATPHVSPLQVNPRHDTPAPAKSNPVAVEKPAPQPPKAAPSERVGTHINTKA